MIAGYPPFCADDPVKVYAAVLKNAPQLPANFPTHSPPRRGDRKITRSFTYCLGIDSNSMIECTY